MAFKSDVKAVRTNATGSLFGGRTRLRGFILGNSSGGGQVTLNDSRGAQLVVDVPAGILIYLRRFYLKVEYQSAISANTYNRIYR